MALTVIADPAIPLQPPELCEKVMIQAEPKQAVAAYFLALYGRFDQEGVTVSYLSINPRNHFLLLSLIFVKTCPHNLMNGD